MRRQNGREYDAETGLYYFRTRYLDPATRRFTTRDVIEIWGDPANLGNGYTYVGNNPASYIDPLGLETVGIVFDPKKHRGKGSWDTLFGWWDDLKGWLGGGSDVGDDRAIGAIRHLAGQHLIRARRAALEGDCEEYYTMMRLYYQTQAIIDELLGELESMWGWRVLEEALDWAPFGRTLDLIFSGGSPWEIVKSLGWDIVTLIPIGKALKLTGRLGRAIARGIGGLAKPKGRNIALPVLQKLCFTAGTLVMMADGAAKPIEDVQVGEAAASGADVAVDDFVVQAGCPLPGESPFPDDYDEILAEQWRQIRFTLNAPHGGHSDITLLRPIPWIELTGVRVGSMVNMGLPELGLAGPARVVAIEPCPDLGRSDQPGARRVVGKFVTTNAKVVDLWIEGLDEPIGTTPVHPFWSMDRDAWVAAGELRPGEKLATMTGTAVVAAVKSRPGAATVYNLEVHGDHTYYVGDAKLWVHNACKKPGIKEITKRIQKIVDQVVKDLKGQRGGGLTKNQRRAAKRHPKLKPMHRGSAIDREAKNRAKDALRGTGVKITPQGKAGADFKRGKRWWDITTPGQWPRHVDKYGPGGIPIFY